ncbi:hypothetical protein DMC30DRAFT_87614 [Rhodotorula diobovata]|uniref:SnoaL-like domain-containing protein n=1 Tax=Rhodotorula diobovata TaxID=5288 RepID=A0A5C5G1N6_9BASI|nr:hypothetical protein DMC30DRAFT_87614 [Rhodotorula diobovata]
MSRYPFSHPLSVPDAQLDFLARFYQASDRPDAVDEYVSFLAPDVDFVMGLNAVQGHAAVRQIRQNMWGGVVSRKHAPAAVFTSGKGDGKDELMLNGTVSYGLRNGTRVDNVGWAAHVVFAGSDELRMKRYQVWIDGAPLSKALAEQAAAGQTSQ